MVTALKSRLHAAPSLWFTPPSTATQIRSDLQKQGRGYGNIFQVPL
jgi:hypothetical protein